MLETCLIRLETNEFDYSCVAKKYVFHHWLKLLERDYQIKLFKPNSTHDPVE